MVLPRGFRNQHVRVPSDAYSAYDYKIIVEVRPGAVRSDDVHDLGAPNRS